MRAVRMLVVGALALAGMTAVGGPAHADAKPSPDEIKSSTVPVRVDKRLRVTPVDGGGYSGYCVVFAFAGFNDVAGFEPMSVAFKVTGYPYSEPVGDPPYDDKLVYQGFTFTPVGTRHQTLLGDGSYSQGPYATPGDAEAACNESQDIAENQLSDTATITFGHTDLCAAKIRKYLAAQDKVKTAKKKAANTTGPAHVAAVKSLNNAKAKLKKAKKRYKNACK